MFGHHLLHLVVLVIVLISLQGCSAITYKGLSGSPTLFEMNELEVVEAKTEKLNPINVQTPVSDSSDSKISQVRNIVIRKLQWQTEKMDWSFVRGIAHQECAISTPTIQLDQHDYTTQLWLSVVNDKLLVNTTTEIDIANRKVGIKTQAGNLVPFSTKHYATSAFWSGSLWDALQTNDALKIVVGGQELGMKTHEIAISLAPLKAIYPAYQSCLKGAAVLPDSI